MFCFKTGNIRKYKCNIEARSRNKFCGGKAISITYSKYVPVVLVVQHAKRMRSILLSSVACLAVLSFSTLSHKMHDIRERVTEHTMGGLDFHYNFRLKHFSF